jgi:hypothetical protein
MKQIPGRRGQITSYKPRQVCPRGVGDGARAFWRDSLRACPAGDLVQ